ncbi:MAG: hypothetical protein CMQ58_03330 [Gammaproteobacteria bacterium]|nr:hypothetical protein [Gammaproteobacteria bacterium]|tara:strand:- start:3517 stop:3981 length:465 start_codon:yes stop_codon:yes gene_type:complete
MGNLTFSILDLLLLTGIILLFFRVKNNGFLKELVFITILFTYSYIILNNLKTVYDFFEDQGLDYAQSIYNVFIGLFACAGLPFVNFFTGLYIPKFKGVMNIIIGCVIAVIRFLLLIFFILQLFPNFTDASLVKNSFVVNIILSYFENIFIYLLS